MIRIRCLLLQSTWTIPYLSYTKCRIRYLALHYIRKSIFVYDFGFRKHIAWNIYWTFSKVSATTAVDIFRVKDSERFGSCHIHLALDDLPTVWKILPSHEAYFWRLENVTILRGVFLKANAIHLTCSYGNLRTRIIFNFSWKLFVCYAGKEL
jgi:hypothetical protein